MFVVDEIVQKITCGTFPIQIIGNIVLENVSASINKADMGHSLLGMTFLKRLSSYEFTEGKLILRP